MISTDSDNRDWRTYGAAMERGQPFIELTLDVPGAIELGNFVGAFTALAGAYDRFVEAKDPKLVKDATIFVQEVRQGSIVAVLMPWIQVIGGTVEGMSAILTVEQFVTTYGKRLLSLAGPNQDALTDASPGEYKDFIDQVGAIASTPGSTMSVAAFESIDGEKTVRSVFKFDTADARQIKDRAEVLKHQAQNKTGETASRVLMVFTRTDVGKSAVGKSTGERVKIESISNRRLALIYGADLAEERIKHEIREAEENVYKKGFIVDVVVETRNGKPVGYSVIHVHDVVELPDDDED